MSFVTITAIIDSTSKETISVPIESEDVFLLASVFRDSNKVVAFKVIDETPVLPKHFGFGSDWNDKWVTKFTQEHWSS